MRSDAEADLRAVRVAADVRPGLNAATVIAWLVFAGRPVRPSRLGDHPVNRCVRRARSRSSKPPHPGWRLDPGLNVTSSHPDANYLFVLSGERTPQIDQDAEDAYGSPSHGR